MSDINRDPFQEPLTSDQMEALKEGKQHVKCVKCGKSYSSFAHSCDVDHGGEVPSRDIDDPDLVPEGTRDLVLQNFKPCYTEEDLARVTKERDEARELSNALYGKGDTSLWDLYSRAQKERDEYKNGLSQIQKEYCELVDHSHEVRKDRDTLAGLIDVISQACGFPVVEDRKQVTETICKRIKRVDAKVNKLLAELEKIRTTT